jgi:hypothetical protein
MWKKIMLGFLCLTIFCVVLSPAEAEDLIFSEDFETGFPSGWSVDNGVWELCARSEYYPDLGWLFFETVCDGNYPNYTDSRLITSIIFLPEATGNEEIHLRFWQWFSYYPYNVSNSQDWGQVQIQTYGEATGWSGWQDLGSHIQDSSGVWSLKSVDLTEFSGQTVRIAFYHISDEQDTSSGWKIDNIEVIKQIPELTWDFECGWDNWYADRGLWQLGAPANGPSNCYSGTKCVGTILAGSYPNFTDSRLVSASFKLPELGECESISLRFWQWFSYYPYNVSNSQDWGKVQIQTYDEATGWSGWQDLGSHIQDSSGGWSLKSEDLTGYEGMKVRIAFYHISDEQDTSSGWYIDHIRIECDGTSLFPHFCECDFNQDGSCNILDWPYFIEDWGRDDCGTPPGSGNPPSDCECDLNKDGICNILDWPRFIDDWGNLNCLTCFE